jgi:hypothetical protein
MKASLALSLSLLLGLSLAGSAGAGGPVVQAVPRGAQPAQPKPGFEAPPLSPGAAPAADVLKSRPNLQTAPRNPPDSKIRKLNQGTIFKLPDLVIVMKWGSGNSASQISVKNAGGGPAAASTLHMTCSNSQQDVDNGDLYWSCDPGGPKGYKEWDWSIPALAPGQQHAVTYPLAAANPSYAIWQAEADYDHAVMESNETNNRKSNH